MDGYTIYIGVKSDDMVPAVVENIQNLHYKVMLGNNVKSFSELVNKCINDCTTEIMIFCSHRVKPSEEDIFRLVSKINEGYGYVGLYRFACFGIHKKVIDKIGYFDENFVAGYEDDDFRIRLNYFNIGFYEDHSVKYTAGPTTWTNNRSVEEKYLHKKYTIDVKNKTIKINIHNKVNINIDTSMFLKHSDSIYVKNVGSYYGMCGPGIHDFKFI